MKLLVLICFYMIEELWSKLGYEDIILYEVWFVFDEVKFVDDEVEIVV